MHPRDLVTWKGQIGRGPYAAWGCLLVALKYNLDRLVAFQFHKSWFATSYLISSSSLEQVLHSPEDRRLYLWLVLLALPFVWSGVVLTLRRLRSVSAPAALVSLFFLPGVNLLLFLLLVLIPGNDEERPDRPHLPWLARLIPVDPLASAALAVLLSLLLGLPATALGVNFLKDYGWGLFVGIPFCQGLLAALLAGYHFPRSFGACMLVSSLAVVLTAAGILALAVEGAICIAMAAPIGLVLAWLGGTLGFFLQASHWRERGTPIVALLFFMAPGMVYADARMRERPPLWEVTTVCDIAAPAEVVWQHVVQFSELPPPKELLFSTGIAYPIRATIDGKGPGAVRRCEFSTAPFVEPIEVWDEPHRLAFSVIAQPPPMHELSPYNNLHPPHLDHFLVSEKGQFLLEPLPDGGTRLIGTTWYRHNIWPAAYWRFFSDRVLHTIHRRVLEHIKRESEATAR